MRIKITVASTEQHFKIGQHVGIDIGNTVGFPIGSLSGQFKVVELAAEPCVSPTVDTNLCFQWTCELEMVS